MKATTRRADGTIELDPNFYEDTRPQAIEDAKKK